MSADYGRTFALTNQPTPNIWLPLNGSVADSMGLSVVTATGSPGYVTLNYPGYTAQAVNLANTAGGTATRYIRGTCPSNPANLTISFWVNPQTIGASQCIFSAYGQAFVCFLQSTNLINFLFPSGSGQVNIVASMAFAVNTWYYITAIFQTNGTCSLYINNSLQGTVTNSGGYGSYTGTLFSLGTYDNATNFAFNGYIDDLRITNSVSAYVPIPLLQPNIWLPFENSAGDLGSHSLPPSATPTIYLPFEGNVTDSVGSSAPVATGAVSYPQANREGYTGQAIRLTNPAGGTAVQYVRGTWSSPTIYTVSGWFNLQSYTTPNNQFIFSTGGTTGASAVLVYVNASNILVAQIPNSVTISSGTVVLLNTWYYFTLKIFPSGSVCSLYLNNSVYTATATATGAASGAFGLGTFDSSSQANAFNGLIDDFRIYNADVPYVPVSNVNITGSVSYVPGVVGLNAVNLVNTAGGTATNFIRGACSPMGSDITVSGWFNVQSFSTNGYQVIFEMYGNSIELYVDDANRRVIGRVASGSGLSILEMAAPISLNTWYHTCIIFRVNGACSFHLNGTLIQTVTNSGGYGTRTSTSLFSLGTYATTSPINAFNGYVDDFRIYNAAIPYHVLFPQNYRSLALSGTGQYALASAASGWVVGSSDSLRTWSKQAVCVGTQSDFIQPQLTGLSQPSWEKNGIVWTSSVSSQLGGTPYSYHPFQNTNGGNIWISLGNYSSGVYNNTYSTTVQGGIGTVYGEWLQIQSSVPLVITSYTFQVYNSGNLPKSYYIVGSADGLTNWYPIQLCVLATNPITTTNVKCSNDLLVNFNGTQTLIGNVSSTVTTTAYTSTTTPYTHFRIIVTGLFSTATYAEIGEWYVNFVRPLTSSRPPTHALSLNHTGQYQMVATGPATGSIMPNQTGLVETSWSQGGVNWGVSASSVLAGGWNPYTSFNNSLGSDFNVWASSGGYNGSGTYTGSLSTTVSGIGAVAGEWLQLQSSVPLVMASYIMSSANSSNPNKSYVIAGSNDGIIWYAIQSASWAANPFGSYTTLTSYINANFTGTQSLTSTSTQNLITTSYITSTNAYTYFRAIGTANFSSAAPSQYYEIGEWYINFSNSVSYSSNYGSTWLNTSRTVSNESVALSSSGQYALSTNSVAPFARLTFDNTAVDAQGRLTPTTGAGSPDYSTPIFKVGTHSAFFNNTPGAVAANYLNYTIPSALATPSMLTQACWVYPTAYGDGINRVWFMGLSGPTTNGSLLGIDPDGTLLHFTGTTANAVYYTITTTSFIAPLNTWTHVAMTFGGGTITLYINGIARATTSAVMGNLSQDSVGSYAALTNLYIGTPYPAALRAYRGYVDDVRIYTSALNADEINSLYKNPALTQTVAVSSSYLPITGYIEPALPGITANIVDTAVSQTGQYMVAVTSSTTNNVYYSTDYGATFTALTVGSSAMVSCSISYDGSYLTVESATTVHTLNRNTRGFSVTVGNQAGLINQAQNAIAIGDKAGRTNQSANSIVLNATGNALDAVAPGFYVAPVATAASSSAAPFNLLGYGTDNQIVQSSALTVLQNGNMGIGTANPGFTLDVWGTIVSRASYQQLGAFMKGYLVPGIVGGASFGVIGGGGNTVTSLYLTDSSFVGIGTNAPAGLLEIYSSSTTGAVSSLVINNSTSGPYRIYIGMAGQTNNGLTGATTGDCIIRNDAGNFRFGYGNTCNVTFTSGGAVGIGTTNPFYKLEVSRTIRIFAAQDATPTLAFNTNPASFSDAYITGEDNGSFGHNIGFYTSVNSASPVKRMTIFGNGNVSFTGTISKGGGTFDITHPLYPDTSKRLVHSFIEGPRCDLIYRGKTTLVNGTAVVDINKECTHSPECAMDDGTFEALCDNAECFLQNKTGFTRVIGVITGGILTITAESENATDTIVWMVIGERADPFIKQWDRTNPDGYLITQYTAENNTTEMSSE